MGAFFISGAAVAKSAPSAEPALVLYTYDSFMAEGGLGREIIPLFEKQCGCKVKALSSGDGAQILTRLGLDKKRGKKVAHLIVGIDQHLWAQAKPLVESWGRWRPGNFNEILPEVRVGDGFLPFDYGAFALMADEQALKRHKLKAPESIHDLLKPEWKRNLILEDPRTSTPGLALALYAESVLGKEKAIDFWRAMKSQWLTLSPGWSAAYSLFLKGEAPLVWSYTTSQAYHEEHGDKDRRYRAVVFKEGQPLQIEGAALVQGNPNRHAQEFLEFLISDEVQAKIPKRNWMLPVIKGAKLPSSFKSLPKPVKLLSNVPGPNDVKETLTRWSRAVESAQ